MLPGILPIVQGPPRFAFPDATWIGVADSTALLGGGSPLEDGMEVIAFGSAYNGAGSNVVVGVPPGWTNHVYNVNVASPKYGIGIWSKKLAGAETPDFFTNHSQAQMHFYGFRSGSPALLAKYSVPSIVQWAQDSLNGDPPSELGNISAIGSKSFLIVGAFRSTGTINNDSISYNSGDNRLLRNANSQTNNYLVSRLNFLPGIKSIPTGDVTFDLGDNGDANSFVGCPLTIG